VSRSAASVVIACHTEERFDMLLQAIVSVQEQLPAPEQVIVAVDHNQRLSKRLRSEVAGIEVVDHSGDRGASATRNTGTELARGQLLVFIDDDALPHPG
jgi:glycosyltransferase involved in cell wall biosynthesis